MSAFGSILQSLLRQPRWMKCGGLLLGLLALFAAGAGGAAWLVGGPPAEASTGTVELAIGLPGTAFLNAFTLNTGIPILNTGTATALSVQITSIALGSGTLLTSPTLPFSLGSIGTEGMDGGMKPVFATFNSPNATLVPGGQYPLTVAGTYQFNGSTVNFTLTQTLQIPAAAPGAADSNSATVAPHPPRAPSRPSRRPSTNSMRTSLLLLKPLVRLCLSLRPVVPNWAVGPRRFNGLFRPPARSLFRSTSALVMAASRVLPRSQVAPAPRGPAETLCLLLRTPAPFTLLMAAPHLQNWTPLPSLTIKWKADSVATRSCNMHPASIALSGSCSSAAPRSPAASKGRICSALRWPDLRTLSPTPRLPGLIGISIPTSRSASETIGWTIPTWRWETIIFT